MNRSGYILAFAAMLLSLTVAGQGLREGLPRYERVHKNNFWNGSRNVTGVRQDSISRSYAEVYGRYENGPFRDTWQAEQAWGAGAATASIRHLDRISFAGSFSFDQTESYGMCGSMFIKPGLYPVDVLEFTPGRKSLQTYAFNGGVSYDLSRNWRIGAKMDFEAANIAKRKDLRHENKRLEMTVAPGFMYHNGGFAIGMNYIFNKTGETIKAEQIGIAESSYWAFLDKGMMYGVHSVWTGSGIHLDDSGVNSFPVNDFSNGIALQMQWKGLFAEVEYLNMKGRIGEKEYVWFNYPGDSFGAQIGYTFTETVRHNAHVGFGWKRLGLDETILEKVTENGVSTVIEHGSNRILSREVVSLAPEYEIVSNMFELYAGAELSWTSSAGSQMYPYIIDQSLFSYRAEMGIMLIMRRFDFMAAAGIAGGKVDESRRLAADNSGILGEPFRLEDWYQRSIDYQTALKSFVSGGVRYNFRNGIYLEGDVDIVQKGFRLNGEMHARTELKMRIGYEF